MEKVVRFVKLGEDFNNELYWLGLTVTERLAQLEEIRQEVILMKYGPDYPQRLQRVYRVTKRE